MIAGSICIYQELKLSHVTPRRMESPKRTTHSQQQQLATPRSLAVSEPDQIIRPSSSSSTTTTFAWKTDNFNPCIDASCPTGQICLDFNQLSSIWFHVCSDKSRCRCRRSLYKSLFSWPWNSTTYASCCLLSCTYICWLTACNQTTHLSCTFTILIQPHVRIQQLFTYYRLLATLPALLCSTGANERTDEQRSSGILARSLAVGRDQRWICLLCYTYTYVCMYI